MKMYKSSSQLSLKISKKWLQIESVHSTRVVKIEDRNFASNIKWETFSGTLPLPDWISTFLMQDPEPSRRSMTHPQICVASLR